MSDPFIGQIVMFGGNFAPRGWALCDGQLLQISSNPALFSILGTTYGGDGRTTFGLPDLRGRVPVHPGSGPGLTRRNLGERSGVETVTLNTNQLPAHSHPATATGKLKASQDPASSHSPQTNVLAQAFGPDAPGPGAGDVYGSAANLVDMDPAALELSASTGDAGGGQPVDNVQPFLGIHFIIALIGVFPSRN